MNDTMTRLTRAVALTGALLGIAANTGSATPASPDKGTGCFVGDANGDYYYDAACSAHAVTKLDADGTFAFYEYQDAGQLPAGAALPSSAIHRSFELCMDFGLGVKCGTATETVTPTGAYKSMFTAR